MSLKVSKEHLRAFRGSFKGLECVCSGCLFCLGPGVY